MEVVGPTTDTAVGDIVVVNVNPDGPYGIDFMPDDDGCAAIVYSWERLPNGKFGPLQKHGGIHVGDVLFAVNDTPLDVMPHKEALAMINNRNLLKKQFKFMSMNEYNRKKKIGNNITAPMVNDSKNNFLSIVKRARVSQTSLSSSSQFVEYEIACQMRVMSSRVQKEIVYKWSVWRRYSDFDRLNNELRSSLGWQMDNIEFPSSHTFVLNKFSPQFIEKRREDLNEYWQKVLNIDKVTEFSKHHCSRELKVFLDVENATNNSKPIIVSDLIDENESADAATAAPIESTSNINSTASSISRRSFKVTSTSSRRRTATSSGKLAGLLTAPSDSGSSMTAKSGIVEKVDPVTPIDAPMKTPPPPPPPPPRRNTVACASDAVASTASAATPVTVAAPPPPPPQERPKSMPARPAGMMNLLADIKKNRIE